MTLIEKPIIGVGVNTQLSQDWWADLMKLSDGDRCRINFEAKQVGTGRLQE